MAPVLRVVEHTIAGQHIREYPGATKYDQEDVLKLNIKQYVPISTQDEAPPNALTIIGAHGIGFPKETYEPLWEEIYHCLQSHGICIRGIWMADCSNQGTSGILNEEVQGDNTSWFDHSRDLLLMVNHFRAAMPRPLIGIGHSMGCAQLVQLGLMHPRLLSTLILIEPVILQEHDRKPGPAIMATTRRDLWDTQEAAEKSLRKAFSKWDPRVMEKYLTYGLRATPTALHRPGQEARGQTSVTLTTSKHQESWAYAQINFEPQEAGLDRLLLPDWDSNLGLPHIAFRPESFVTMHNLPHLRPSVFYVFGATSPLSSPQLQEQKVERTGTGTGGSGGRAEGRVRKEVIQNTGHLPVFEQPQATANLVAEWVSAWFDRWLQDEHLLSSHKSKKSDDDMLRVSPAWVQAVKLPSIAPRPVRPKI